MLDCGNTSIPGSISTLVTRHRLQEYGTELSTSCILNVHFSATAGGALVSLTLIDLSIQHNRTQLQDCRNGFSSKTFSKLDILELLLQDMMMMMMVIMMIMCIYFIYL